MDTLRVVFLLLAVSLLGGCGYHQIQADDEQVLASASELITLSRRRLDQVPNLVQVVQTHAPSEKEMLRRVAATRETTVAHLPVTPESLADQTVLVEFAKGNLALSQSVSGLLRIAENYPALKADANYRDLQAQMEEAEGRIDTAEHRYAEAVRAYNVAIGSLPNSVTAMLMGARPKGEVR